MRRRSMEPPKKKRTLLFEKTDEPWWNMPWTVWLLEDGVRVNLAVGMTRSGALRRLNYSIKQRDKPKPETIYSEEVPIHYA